jgi:hypothetical protein
VFLCRLLLVRLRSQVYCGFFPRFYLVADAILTLMQHRLDAVLVVPCGVRSWTPLLARLPVAASQHLSGPNLVILGRHVPAYMRAPTYNLHLRALLVLFTKNGPQCCKL